VGREHAAQTTIPITAEGAQYPGSKGKRIPRVPPRKCRVLMDRLNVPMKVRQQRLGHGDAKITLDVYTHTAGQDSAVAATELGRIVWGKSPEILDANRTQIKNGLASTMR
jgi:integrase